MESDKSLLALFSSIGLQGSPKRATLLRRVLKVLFLAKGTAVQNVPEEKGGGGI